MQVGILINDVSFGCFQLLYALQKIFERFCFFHLIMENFIQQITCSAETVRSHDCGKAFMENSG